MENKKERDISTRASVALAAYNGEKFIKEQIDSILDMMNQNDELVISYDESSDKTWQIISEYSNKDKRVKVYKDKGKGLESNFNNAVEHCNGKYIFLADQDDVWINNKINVMIAYMQKTGAKVLICDGYETDENLKKLYGLYQKYRTTESPFKNYVKGSYLGCQMAFSADIKDQIWPVNENPPIAHDLWLGILGSYYGKVIMINDKLMYHRLHGDNYTYTSKMSLFNVIKNRIYFASSIIKRIKKNGKKKK